MDYKVEIAFNKQAVLGECPVWSEEEKLLYWVDISKGLLNRFDPIKGENEYIKFDEEIACFAFREKKGFIVALRNKIYLLDDFSTNNMKFIASPKDKFPNHRFNDGKCDSMGRFWLGTMNEKKDKANASLYCLDNNLKLVKKETGVYTSNGLAFIANKLYYADTSSFKIYSYDIDMQSSKISNKQVFFQSSNLKPDGACVDNENNYWLAIFGSSCVVKLSKKGELIRRIDLPVKYPTMPCFGGEDLKTLYITSASKPLSEEDKIKNPYEGCLLKIKMDVCGQYSHKFKENF